MAKQVRRVSGTREDDVNHEAASVEADETDGKKKTKAKGEESSVPTPTQEELDAQREARQRTTVAGSPGTYETR